MKLTTAAAIILSLASLALSDGITVVENFLSNEECDDILRQQLQQQQRSVQHGDIILSDGKAATTVKKPTKVSHIIKRRMATTLAFVMSSCDDDATEETCDMHPDIARRLDKYLSSSMATTDSPELVATTVMQSTTPHTDCWYDPITNEQENVTTAALVFLDDHDGAFFSHGGQDHVRAKRGNLVLFDGAVEHSTILRSSSVGPLHLLGPCMLTHGHGLAHVADSCGGGESGSPCDTTPAPGRTMKNKKAKKNLGMMY